MQLVKFLHFSDSAECHASEHSVCGEWDTIRMLMCCECSSFLLDVTVLWLTFAAKVFAHLSPFVTQIYTCTHLQLRFVQDNFMLEKGESLYSFTCCLCKCTEAWHPCKNSFTLCLWFSLSVRNSTCIVLSAENQILTWYISFFPPVL